jgi:hypothetical protein
LGGQVPGGINRASSNLNNNICKRDKSTGAQTGFRRETERGIIGGKDGSAERSQTQNN